MIRLAVATTGGDAPGMNPCLRALVKGAPTDVEVFGIRYGGLGLLRNRSEADASASGLESDYFHIGAPAVSNILHIGSTVLKTSRMEGIRRFIAEQQFESLDDAIASLAPDALSRHSIAGMVLIGGDTSSSAAYAIARATNHEVPILVIPASIDNDIWGTQQTLGFDSALQVAIQSVDYIRTTAASLDRIFVIEVMGKAHGQIALDTAFASGAEEVLIPEVDYTLDALDEICRRLIRNAGSAIAIVAEGARLPGTPQQDAGPAASFVSYLRPIAEEAGREVRLVQLGHVLRGAPPTATTRLLALHCGMKAVDEIVRRVRQKKATEPHLISIKNGGDLSLVRIQEDMRRRDTRATQAAYEQFRRLAY